MQHVSAVSAPPRIKLGRAVEYPATPAVPATPKSINVDADKAQQLAPSLLQEAAVGL